MKVVVAWWLGPKAFFSVTSAQGIAQSRVDCKLLSVNDYKPAWTAPALSKCSDSQGLPTEEQG